MKRNLLKILPFLLLGGVLGLAAAPAAFEAAGVKAEDEETKTVTFSMSNIASSIGTSGYTDKPTFTQGDVSFAGTKLMGNNSYIQINGKTSDGFWTTSTFENYYISKVEIIVAQNDANLFMGTSTNPTGSAIPIAKGNTAVVKEFTQQNGYTHLSVHPAAAKYVQVKKFAITYTKNSDEPLPPFEGDYSVVSDASTLKSGDKIVLAYESKGMVSGAFGSYSYFTAVSGTFSDGEMSSDCADEITLVQTDGGWNLYAANEGFIGCSENGKLSKGVKDVWTISIGTENVASINNGTYNIKFNANTGTYRFAGYTGDATDTMPFPQIYKNKTSAADTYTITYDGNGAASGSVVDSNSPYNAYSTVTVLENTFTPVTGQSFKEWNTQADGSGTSYAPGATFDIKANTTLYAIWDEEYIPIGDAYTQVTDASTLKAGDQVLFVYRSGDTVKVNGGLEGNKYFSVYDAKIIDDELTYNNEKICPLTLSGSADNWKITNGTNYLYVNAANNNELYFGTSAKASVWSISVSSGVASVSTVVGTSTQSIKYNGSGVARFSNYASGQSAIELWAKTGHAKEVHLSVDSLDLNVTQKGIITVSECIGFEPSSYLWEITSGDDVISIYSGQGTKEILVEALKEGEAEVYVTVDGVKATCAVTVHDYKYNILDKENYYITTGGAMLGGDTSYISEVDFSNATNMWHFEKAYEGDNSYYLTANDKYLAFSEDVYEDGKNVSQIQLSDVPVNVWVVTYSESNGYKVATQTKKQGVRSLAIHEEQWFAFTGNNYVDLLEGGTFDHYAVEALPTTKQYFVGDELKPLNSHVYAYYTNGFKAEITNKITWEPLTAGTKAYGTCTILGAEVDIEMDGLKIYKGDASTFVINGLHDTYSIGERINKDNLTIGITYKLSGSEDIVKDSLAKDDYTITPEKIVEGTEKIRIALAKDPTVYYEQDIEVKESSYVAASHIKAGDKIILGTLGYNPYEITGGKELSYTGDKFSYETFDYMPRGEMPLEVGKEGSYFTLKDPVTGYYLKGDNSAITFNEPDYKSVYAEGDGHYEFNLSVTIGGTSIIAEMKTTLEPDFSNPMVFSSMTYVGGYEDYVVGTSHLDENKFTFDMWSKKNNYEEVYATAEVEIADWKFTGGAFYYALEISSTLPEECLFTMNYDEDFEEWVVSSKPHQDKQLYFNKDGKFGFYTKGSSYTPVMVFRDNDLPLESEPISVSVGFMPIEGTEPQEYMNTVTVGEQFPWTSALVVTAKYSGGASKVIPVGGYTMKQMPDTSKIGPATGIISYGQNGHQIDKEFTVYVTGHTHAFDVVCPDPIRVGETLQAHLADHYEPPEGEPITWSVSDPTLASIDQDGNVTGLKAGYVDVIATSYDGTYSDYEHIRIFQNVVSLSLDKTSMTIEAGTKEAITATVLPTDASNPNVTWSSSDANIASVNNKGEVTGLSVGTTTITCTTQGKPFGAEEPLTATCEVTVTPGSVVRVSGVSLDCEYKELKPGDTFQLNAIVNPSNATNKNVTWESNAPHLADVSNSGKVTVKASAATGKTVYITCKTEDGGYTARCEIKIKASVTPVPVTSISLDITSKKIDVDETFEIVATINPSDATDKHIDWSSSNEDVVEIISVGPSGVTVKGMSDGTATITASCGGKTATCKVTVGDQPTPPPTPVTHVESVTLSESKVRVAIDGTYTLIATINPSDADNKKVTWSSSDTSVATVKNGIVTGIAAGTATITVKTADGGKTATCTITVFDKAEQARTNAIIAGSVGGTVAVGAGCGIGIPLGLKAKKRRLHK